ncbi:YisB protein [Xylariaceae sp. FL1272]|nr:YisB protein [Xylariaceae sp. FL1272]
MSIPEDQNQNFELFRDCLDTALIEKISEPRKKSKERRRTKTRDKKRTPGHQPSDEARLGNETAVGEEAVDIFQQSAISTAILDENQADQDTSENADLADFTEYIATEIFACLPPELKTIDYNDYIATPSLQERYPLPLTGEDIAIHLPLLDSDIGDSLIAYGIIHENVQGIDEFLAPVLTAYLTAISTKPPPPVSTRADACEICGRDWVNLTYHHLIPRFVHAKAVKRGWHREADLQNVAWLCRACHSFVHRFAGHEELARNYYTVELLLAEEEVRRWAQWVARLRWKGK